MVIREKKVDENNISLPARPPMFCPGCPTRGLFYALSKIDCVVSGDIECYSLGVFPPYERLDTILCMGAGITVAQGMDKAGIRDKPVIGIIGDSLDFEQTLNVLKKEVKKEAASVIISRRACVLVEKLKGKPLTVDSDKCTQCGRCLKIGCSAIYRERTNKKAITIDEILCTGCSFCTQICPKEAIIPTE